MRPASNAFPAESWRSPWPRWAPRPTTAGISPLVPGRFWLFGLADASRVWVDGEDSNDWHPSFGGGLAVELAGAPLAFWVGAARTRGSDDTLVYFRSGLGF